jgi:phage-related protein
MQEFEFDVKFYETLNGEEPIKDFIEKLKESANTNKEDRTRVKKILTYIHSLEQYGTRMGYPHVKHIEGDIWELRPFNDRIFFFYCKNKTFILLHHFLKKTNKTPKREIAQAERNMKDYLERSEKNGE